jgi:hypothetical protein
MKNVRHHRQETGRQAAFRRESSDAEPVFGMRAGGKLMGMRAHSPRILAEDNGTALESRILGNTDP